jgi:hypothetical protein
VRRRRDAANGPPDRHSVPAGVGVCLPESQLTLSRMRPNSDMDSNSGSSRNPNPRANSLMQPVAATAARSQGRSVHYRAAPVEVNPPGGITAADFSRVATDM